MDFLFRAADFAVIDKPAGVSCHNDGTSVLTLLGPGYHLVHRLDKETSGLLMVTRKPELHARLQQSIHEGEKEYFAVLRGSVPVAQQWQTWDSPISDAAESRTNPQGPAATRVSALTLYLPENTNAYFSLIRCLLRSGRQHQIRKHAALAGRPVVGDARYGKTKDNERIRTRYGFSRMALHAHRLTFKWNDEEIAIRSPMPPEFGLLFPESGPS